MKKRLLHVDDEEEIRDIVSEIAEMCDYEVCSIGDYQTFQQSILTFKPNIVLLDLHLNDTDGIELLYYLKKVNFNGDVILCSGLDNRLLNAGVAIGKEQGLKMLDHLQKPIRVNELISLLKDYLPKTPDINHDSICQAIKEQRFVIHYQPKYSLALKKVIGVEALLRWNYHDNLLLYPDSFIPIAEQIQAIDMLTNWVIDQALQDMKEWEEKGIDLTVSINIPANFLINTGITQILVSKISAMDIPLSHITFEITETSVMALPSITKDIISRLRIRGISFSIDDFGTGYSSLISLHNIPFNELKIDKVFIMHLSEDHDAQKIVKSSINLAHNLGMTVVAEGVETLESLKILKDLGCDIGQGYLFSKAVPKEALIQWLQDRRQQPWHTL